MNAILEVGRRVFGVVEGPKIKLQELKVSGINGWRWTT
jgi:hypothetical protein